MKKAENVSSEPIDVTDTNAFFFKINCCLYEICTFFFGKSILCSQVLHFETKVK